MTFRKFGKTSLTAALSLAIAFSLTSCIRSFTVGYLYVTGTVTSTPSGNGIITGFKINNDNGKLTPINGTPLASGGSNPVRAVLLTSGNFVYVLNQGATASGGNVCTTADPCSGANITQFVVGGNGSLTPQENFPTQGFNPIRLIADSSGGYLFALDHDAPGSVDPTKPSSATNPNPYCPTVVAGATSCGDITAFSINPSTGRLSLIPNAQLSSSTGTQITYFPVPASPIDFNMASGYLMTLAGAASPSPTSIITNAANGQTVYPYTFNSSNGQLGVSQSTPQFITNGAGTPVGQAKTLNFAGGKVYILDNEPLTASGTPGQLLPFTVGTNGALQALVGGAVADDPSQTDPVQLLVESKGRFIYVANSQGSGINSGAGIVGYTIDPTSSQLSQTPGSPFLLENTGSGSPNGTGAQPVCILEDPSNQYIYTANAGDSTVTGKVLDPNAGALTQMKGSTGVFALSGPASWCWVTGRTN